jgi:hypothetical protein
MSILRPALHSLQCSRLLRLVDTAGPRVGLPRSGLGACGNGCNRAIALVCLVIEWSRSARSQSLEKWFDRRE